MFNYFIYVALHGFLLAQAPSFSVSLQRRKFESILRLRNGGGAIGATVNYAKHFHFSTEQILCNSPFFHLLPSISRRVTTISCGAPYHSPAG